MNKQKSYWLIYSSLKGLLAVAGKLKRRTTLENTQEDNPIKVFILPTSRSSSSIPLSILDQMLKNNFTVYSPGLLPKAS